MSSGRLGPLDLTGKSFTRIARGYAPERVDALLGEVAEELKRRAQGHRPVLSAAQVRATTFDRGPVGYRAQEVDDFLELVATELEQSEFSPAPDLPGWSPVEGARPVTAAELRRPRLRRALRGYAVNEVDALLERLAAALADVESGAQPTVTSSDVQHAGFSVRPFGYDMRQVDELLGQVQRRLPVGGLQPPPTGTQPIAMDGGPRRRRRLLGAGLVVLAIALVGIGFGRDEDDLLSLLNLVAIAPFGLAGLYQLLTPRQLERLDAEHDDRRGRSIVVLIGASVILTIGFVFLSVGFHPPPGTPATESNSDRIAGAIFTGMGATFAAIGLWLRATPPRTIQPNDQVRDEIRTETRWGVASIVGGLVILLLGLGMMFGPGERVGVAESWPAFLLLLFFVPAGIVKVLRTRPLRRLQALTKPGVPSRPMRITDLEDGGGVLWVLLEHEHGGRLPVWAPLRGRQGVPQLDVHHEVLGDPKPGGHVAVRRPDGRILWTDGTCQAAKLISDP